MFKLIANMSMKSKLLMSNLLMAILLLAVGFFSFYSLSTVSTHYGKVVTLNMPRVRFTEELFVRFERIRINLRTLGLSGLSPGKQQAAVAEATLSIAEYEQLKSALLAVQCIPGKAFCNDTEDQKFSAVDTAWSRFKEIGQKVLSYQTVGTKESHDKMMEVFAKECPDAADVYQGAIEDFLEYQSSLTNINVDEAQTAAKKSTIWMLGMIACGVFIGIGVAFAFASYIIKAINHVTELLTENSVQLAAASETIASSSQELSQATTEQAASLQETAASIEEMSSMVTKNSENARMAADTSSQSQLRAEEGKEAVGQMVHAMDDINSANDNIMNQITQSNAQMTEILTVISEIGNKTKVINDIVFQTKLLSFNASVEAARAGEHGKGFAVVAEEVGSLAQMSGNAAKEISDMLAEGNQKVAKIVAHTKSSVESLIKEGKAKVEVGNSVAQQCGQILNNIVSNVGDVNRMAGEISVASQEQSTGVREITNAIGQLETATQQNATNSEHSSKAAEELASQAETLKAAVRDLIQLVRGGKASATTGYETRVSQSPVKSIKKSVVAHSKAVKNSTVQVRGPEEKHKKITDKVSGNNTPNANHEGFKEEAS